MGPLSDSQLSLIIASVCIYVLVMGARTLYSVYFGPLAKFPGPKLAAATLWYEFYYDVILLGQYTFKIKELHRQYGPIIRISPYELHIDDPDYYDELYSQHKPRNNWNRLDDPDFSRVWVDTVKATVYAGHFLKQFPFMHTVLNAVPIWILGAINPGMGMLLQWRKEMQDETQEVIDGNYKSSQEQLDLGLQKTIFNELLESDLPPEEKLHSRLWQEGLVVVGADLDTTAATLTVIHFWLLEKPELLRKLRTELESVMPDKFAPPQLSTVEKLPFLNALVNEGLRLSYGVSTRLQRSSPTEAMKFHDWEIPPGTPVGMTSVHIHHNETIFPDSHEFKPERWLEKGPEGAPPLEKYLVSFSRGSRQCIGMNLAKAELYLTLATIFRRYEHQELFETTRMDVDLKHDMFMPQPDMRSKGVSVLFK